MEIADPVFVSSFLQLSNYFAENSNFPTIQSLTELWKSHGKLMVKLLQIDSDFESSQEFYSHVLHKLKFINAQCAEGLDAQQAANGNVLEICKFFALYLEFLRKEQGEILKRVLEQLSSNTSFNNDVLLNMFVFFDKLYADDCADDWWSILRQEPIIEEFVGFATPKRSHDMHFATPITSRLRSTTKSFRRSPIVDAVDSPTMKFLRSERELKQLKHKYNEVEGKLDEAEVENSALLQENRQLKLNLQELRENHSEGKMSKRIAEEIVEKSQKEIEELTNRYNSLVRELNAAKENNRSFIRQLSEMEEEKVSYVKKIDTITKEKEAMMKGLREARESYEADYSRWKEMERELTSQKDTLLQENVNVGIELANSHSVIATMSGENERLKTGNETLKDEIEWHNSKIFGLTEERQKLQEKHDQELKVELKEKENAVAAERIKQKMLENTVERLEAELAKEKGDKDRLKGLLDSINDKMLTNEYSDSEQKDAFLKASTYLVAAKGRIELLETEIKVKEDHISSLRSQLSQIASILETEQNIRKDALEQFIEEKRQMEANAEKARASFEAQLEKNGEELKELRFRNAELEEQLNTEKTELEEIVRNQAASVARLEQDVMDLSNGLKKEQDENVYLNKRLTMLEKVEYKTTSYESLNDELRKATDGEEKENEEKIANTPRPSVAFSVDFETENRSTMPPGFKLESAQKETSSRLSIAAEESFDRSSIARSSVRSESSSILKQINFKEPFTPSDPDSARIQELKKRNRMVGAAHRCSYALELGGVESPSGNEENVKQATLKSTAKKRRPSIGNFFSKK